jgi:hypothetical protein
MEWFDKSTHEPPKDRWILVWDRQSTGNIWQAQWDSWDGAWIPLILGYHGYCDTCSTEPDEFTHWAYHPERE